MVERKSEDYCKTKNAQCVVLPLAEQKDKLIDIFLEEARKSFNQASSDYDEGYKIMQKEIDSLSLNCPDICPYNSKSLAQEAQAFLSNLAKKISS